MLVPLALVASLLLPVSALTPCAGDTRGDGRCNHDPTHRVCARIGVPGTSFWRFTGQRSWCGTTFDYGNGDKERCPAGEPTWCICKWATASWIEGQGCDETVQIDCDATDVCDLRNSYKDFDQDLAVAHTCVKQKCPTHWAQCATQV